VECMDLPEAVACRGVEGALVPVVDEGGESMRFSVMVGRGWRWRRWECRWERG